MGPAGEAVVKVRASCGTSPWLDFSRMTISPNGAAVGGRGRLGSDLSFWIYPIGIFLRYLGDNKEIDFLAIFDRY